MIYKLEDYKPGEWYFAKTIDDMQAFFLSRLPAMREAAREKGYALGLHGSLRRDMDVIAVPWIEKYAPPNELAKVVQKAACGFCLSNQNWETKPNGRIACSFPICWVEWQGMVNAGCLDLSVVGH